MSTDAEELEELDDDAELEEAEDAGGEDGDEEQTPEERLAALEAANAKLRKENQSYRERWQPIERVFAGLRDDDAAAIAGFARTVAGGNRPAMLEWLATNATAVAGDDLVDELRKYGFTKGEAKAAVEKAGADEDTVDPGGKDVTQLVKELVEGRLAEERKARLEEQRTQQRVAEVDAGLAKLNLEPGSDEAQEIIAEASRILNRGQGPTGATSDADFMAQLLEQADRALFERWQGKLKERRKPIERTAPPDGASVAPQRPRTAEERVRAIEAKLAGGDR